MIIDFHVHPFIHETEILREMKEAKIEMIVLLGVDVDPSDVEKPEIRSRLIKRHLNSTLAFFDPRSKPIEDEIRAFFQALITSYPELKSSNEEIAELIRRNPDRFIGFGSVNPNKDGDYLESKLNEINNLNLKGVKLLPTLQFFSPSENKNFERICEYCEKNKKILLYHTGCDPGPWENPELSEDANPKYLKPILESYSPIVVLAHAGSYSAHNPGIWFDEALQIANRFENVYFDSSAVSSFIYREKILKKIREKMGLHRLLYGSDFPVVWGSNMKYETEVIEKCQFIDEDEKAQILGLNAAKILNLVPS